MKLILHNLFFVVISFCLTKNGLAQDENCECTVYYLCDADNTVSSSSKCSGPEVCCRAGATTSAVHTASIPKGTTPRTIPKDTNGESNNGAGKTCDCVAPSQCEEASGANQIDYRVGKNCPINQICCPRESITGSTGGSGTGGSTGGGSNTGGSGTGDSTGGSGIGDFDFVECGNRRPADQQFNLANRISGLGSQKSETFFGEYPWMVAILTRRINKDDDSVTENVFQCGASLINKNVVMTAAHCVQNINLEDIKVRAGEWDTLSNNNTDKEPFPYQERTVSEILIHEKFESSSAFNDIALLILDFDFIIKDHIGLICTPNSNVEYEDKDCIVTGWGKDKFGKEGRYQGTLKKLDLNVEPRSSCQQKLRKTRLGNKFQLHEGFLCGSSGAGQDACKGDGGGPLICRLKNEKNRYTQVGIVAWGIGCGSETPGVYMDVYKYKKWILDNSHGKRTDTRIIKKN